MKSINTPAAKCLASFCLSSLNGESVDLYKNGVSASLERIAGEVFSESRPEVWYDGLLEAGIRKRKPSQIEITGNMVVADGLGKQWGETCRVRLTDARAAGMGVQMILEVGEYRGEAQLLAVD